MGHDAKGVGYTNVMSTLEKAEQLLVCGGEACIVRTRVPVWLLVQARRLNTSEADLLRAYPTLRAEDLANAWAYHRAHPEEIERQIQENEAA